MNKENNSVKLYIAGRTYPINIKGKSSAEMKIIVNNINDTINKLQRLYPNNDKQDWLAMAILNFAVMLNEAENKKVTPSFSKKLDEIDILLDQVYKSVLN